MGRAHCDPDAAHRLGRCTAMALLRERVGGVGVAVRVPRHVGSRVAGLLVFRVRVGADEQIPQTAAVTPSGLEPNGASLGDHAWEGLTRWMVIVWVTRRAAG